MKLLPYQEHLHVVTVTNQTVDIGTAEEEEEETESEGGSEEEEA